jgi:hypothetical protein
MHRQSSRDPPGPVWSPPNHAVSATRWLRGREKSALRQKCSMDVNSSYNSYLYVKPALPDILVYLGVYPNSPAHKGQHERKHEADASAGQVLLHGVHSS